MNICICGWYLNQDFLETIVDQGQYGAYIVSHRDAEFEQYCWLPHIQIENIGLEWHAYDYYLRNIWETGNTLFMHDDIRINIDALDRIALLDDNLVYIFSDKHPHNYFAAHGRAVWMDDSILDMYKKHGGFWYDKTNKGDNVGSDCNIGTLNNLHKALEWNRQVAVATVPGFHAGIKGEMDGNTDRDKQGYRSEIKG